MATLGKWSGNTVSHVPTESWAAPNGMFPTEDRNDDYSFTSSTSTLTLPSSGLADGYLMIGAYEYEDASNGRATLQGQIVQTGGTGTFVGGPTSGYCRDNSEDRAYVRTFGFVDNPSASSTYQFQWKRDVDAPTNGTVRSEFQVIPLYYSNHGIYTSTTAALYGGTTPNQTTGWTVQDESNTAAIEHATNVVTVKGDNKKYLIFGSQFYENYGASRTQRWYGLDIDGTKEDAAKSYSYSRNASNDEVGEMYSWIIETVTANRTIESFAYRGDGVAASQGGADIDGSTPTVADHSLVVLELNDSAEVFANIGNGGQNLATTGPIDLTVCDTTDIQFNDSASWTRSTDTAMNAEVAMDALLGANISAAQNTVSDGSRWTAFSEFTVNGTEQTDSFGGDYMRSNQTSQDTFGWSANLLGFLGLSLGDDVGISVTELVGSEGGGGSIDSPDGWEGFWGINLDTLEDVGAPISRDPPKGDLAIAGSAAGLGLQIPAAKADLGLTSQAPALSIDMAVAKADVTLAGQTPGLTQPHGVDVPVANFAVTGQSPLLGESLTPAKADLTLAGQAPAVTSGAEFEFIPPVASLTLTSPNRILGTNVWVNANGYPNALRNRDPNRLYNVQEVWTGNWIAGDPDVIFHNDRYEMFYTDVVSETAIAKALSPNGTEWDFAPTDTGVLGVVLEGELDHPAIETAEVVVKDGTYYMYVTGYDPAVQEPVEGFPADLYLATSTDGINFSYHQTTPIMARTAGWYDNDAIYNADVHFDTDANEFRMVYSGFCINDCAGIGFVFSALITATSSDGITWVKGSPIIQQSAGNPWWCTTSTYNSSLIKYKSDDYVMAFSGDDDDDVPRIGFATASSFTGPWTIQPEPMINLEKGSFYAAGALAPTILMTGSDVKMWFFADGGMFPDWHTGYGEANIERLR